jgi:hypothetical protein
LMFAAGSLRAYSRNPLPRVTIASVAPACPREGRCARSAWADRHPRPRAT